MFCASLARWMAARNVHYGWVVAATTFLTMLATAGAMGSAGVKVMSVVRDVADAYVHAGGQYQWDNAAPVAVARAAGLHCSRVDGSPIVYNEDDVSLPDLIVCRPELAEQIGRVAELAREEERLAQNAENAQAQGQESVSDQWQQEQQLQQEQQFHCIGEKLNLFFLKKKR